jgi:hypothetical protein
VYKLWLDTGSIDNLSAASQQIQQSAAQEEVDIVNNRHDSDVEVGNKNDVFKKSLDGRVDLLTHCYLLADYIGAPAFQNDVMDAISLLYRDLHNTDFSIPLHNIGYICNKTAATSPLRHFLVDTLRYGLSKKTLTKAAEQGLIPLDVAVAIAGDAISDLDEPWNAPYHCLPWLLNPCIFHVHPKGRNSDFNSPCTDPFSTNGREGVWNVKPWEQDYPGSYAW